MREKPDKWIRLVADLIERTQEQRLKWISYVPKDSSRVKVVYRAPHKDKGLRLYRREAGVATGIHGFGPILTNTDAEIVLEVIDDKQNSLWKFPNVPGLDDLLEAVSYQVAGIDDFLSDLLSE